MDVEMAWNPSEVAKWLQASWPGRLSAAHARCLAAVICTFSQGSLSEGALTLEWEGDWTTGRVTIELKTV